MKRVFFLAGTHDKGVNHRYKKVKRIDFIFHSQTVLQFQACSVLQYQPVSITSKEEIASLQLVKELSPIQ
jgi:hypothetical protein